ncbi:cation transporter [Marinicauda salina]|uniref:Cation transporter n=1 Tax=Marinicauda salina TaxID=2135793 RepID=A0A2U2BRV9_9PROT|nr:cation diffusion facilitator family transporter [Marinicauda salina]PWE16751.1 cation transporter [Marinicauda salina]
MAHDHGHGHHHHANETRTLWAAGLTGAFMIAEVIGGILTGSLALLADAAHMFTDFAALGLAWAAFRISRRPADPKRTYGFDRLQVLVAFANGVTLAVLTAWIVAEALGRLAAPEPILAGPMAVVAALGLVVNIAAFAILHGADRDNLNIRGAAAHVMGDLLGSVAALAAAGVILQTGFTPIDSILSLGIAALIAISAARLIRDSGRILLEAAPEEVDPRAIRADLLEAIPGLDDVHHIHVWSITQERPMATLHARMHDPAEAPGIVSAIRERLHDAHGLSHVTVETEIVEPGEAAETAS